MAPVTSVRAMTPIMPEMRQALKQIDDQLESVDQEEAARVRYAARLGEQNGRP